MYDGVLLRDCLRRLWKRVEGGKVFQIGRNPPRGGLRLNKPPLIYASKKPDGL